MPQNSKMLIGAVIAAALAFAVYFGLISQQTAGTVQTQANQTLGTAPASQAAPPPPMSSPAPTPTPTPTTQTPPASTSAPAAPAPAPQPTTPAPKQ